MSIKILLNNTLWSTLNHILSRGILMLSGILLARYLLPKDFAIYSYYQMTVVMISSYASLGMGVAASKFFAELSVDKNNIDNVDMITALISISILVSFLITTLVFFIPNNILASGLNISTYIFAISVLILSLNIVPSGAILGLEKYKEATIISLINGIICLIGVYLSISFNKIIFSIYFFILASIVQLLGYIYLVNQSICHISVRAYLKIKNESIVKLAKFMGPLIFVSILAASSSWILGRVLLLENGEYLFSVYSIGLQWFALALFLPGMVSRVVLPRLIRGESKDNKGILRISCLISIVFSLIIFLIVFIFKGYIIDFYGFKYKKYENILILFLLIAILYAPANTLGNAIVAKLGSLLWLIITIVWFLILIVIFYLIYEKYNIMAVIYAQIISTFFLLLISFLLCKKKGLI